MQALARGGVDRVAPPGVLTRKVLIVFGLVTLPLLTGFAFIVGHFAARAGTGFFDWELASIFGTALGTTLLAVATGALAYTTAGDVRATWQLADLTRQDLDLSRTAQQASIKPRLIDATGEWGSVIFEETDKQTFVAVWAGNVGAGLALIQNATMHWDAGAQETVNPVTYIGTVTRSVVPPEEATRAEFRFGKEAAPRIQRIRDVGRFWVEIGYVDSVGEQAEVTRIDLRSDPSWGWIISRVSFQRAGEAEPYVSSGPGVR